MVSIKFDKDSGAMYVQLRKGKVAKTIPMGKDRFIDVNEKGKIVGMEVLIPTNAPEVDDAIAKSTDIIELIQ
ncbi:MAG: DUF2283 domain-containing protein [Candidatus Nitrosotalea sp.]|nr:DUF2283 domain-containing protein [Candidatus Nitrosotalea sp.]